MKFGDFRRNSGQVLVPNDCQQLLIAVLRLLLNLSFDTQLRTKMMMMDFAPKIAEAFKRNRGSRADGAGVKEEWEMRCDFWLKFATIFDDL